VVSAPTRSKSAAGSRPTTPADWTRLTCAAWVAALDGMNVGDYLQRTIGLEDRVGKPLEAINNTVNPMLCRKGGDPTADVRRSITSHRARSTIASQPCKEPMTLFELHAKTTLQRMLATVPLSDDERAAVDDGQTALDQLLERLADISTPIGAMLRQIGIPAQATLLPVIAVNRKPT
jgi:hypothetical protein